MSFPPSIQSNFSTWVDVVFNRPQFKISVFISISSLTFVCLRLGWWDLDVETTFTSGMALLLRCILMSTNFCCMLEQQFLLALKQPNCLGDQHLSAQYHHRLIINYWFHRNIFSRENYGLWNPYGLLYELLQVWVRVRNLSPVRNPYREQVCRVRQLQVAIQALDFLTTTSNWTGTPQKNWTDFTDEPETFVVHNNRLWCTVIDCRVQHL